MHRNKKSAEPEYLCSEQACTYFWRLQDGYFQIKDGAMFYAPDAHQFLKPALVREHGYLFIEAVEESTQKRTWRCAVQGCENVLVDEV